MAELSKSAERAADARMRFAEKLVTLRKRYGSETGRPQLDMQTMAGDLGIEPERYRRYERGETEPPIWLLEEICRVTKTPVDALIGPRRQTSAADPVDAEFVAAVAKRLRAARAAMAMHVQTDADFAALCGTSVQELSAWLSGKKLPAVKAMARLCKQTGLDLDWIYAGDYEGVRREIAILLRAVLDDVKLTPAQEREPAQVQAAPRPALADRGASKDQRVPAAGRR